MPDILKRNGKTEPFDRGKLVLSMRIAGAGESTAQEIADSIVVRDNMPTDEIRSQIIEELDKRNPSIARHYERTMRFVTRVILEEVKGVVRLTEDTMRRLKVKVGEALHLVHEENEHELIVEATEGEENVIEVHEEDLKTVGAEPGSKVAIRLPRSPIDL